MRERLSASVLNGDEIVGVDGDTERGFETAGAAIENKFFGFAGGIGGIREIGADEVGGGFAGGEIMAAGGVLGQTPRERRLVVRLRDELQVSPDGAAFA